MFVKYQGKLVVAEHVPFHTMPEYRIWHAIWARCTNPNTVNWAQYGGAGIKVHAAWKDFIEFYEHVGPRPSMKHSIDRYPDGAGNYEPGNVRWATVAEQALNKKNAVFVEYEGKQERLVALCERLGASHTHVRGRIRSGWSVEEALTIPINRHANPLGKNIRLTRKKSGTTP